MKIILFTIGFTKKTAKEFFTLIKRNNIKCVIDVRLNNISQLAGFSKRNDLEFFLKRICDCGYKHLPILAPTKEIKDGLQKNELSWGRYSIQYNALLKSRQVEKFISLNDLNQSCLLCSEPTADRCHRRLAAEYLNIQYQQLEISHI